ncbi:S26 family signal peptidase [Streptomyces sp. NBC_01304]|uniref:S26 family signal peptidase n=1 Tax=Streptomyces sp. NBC_01304 TaxID=2903818 RepID=UPI002E10E9B0|nr:S26 family signal peptidase [Streptomyces sp. NBC_01304]
MTRTDPRTGPVLPDPHAAERRHLGARLARAAALLCAVLCTAAVPVAARAYGPLPAVLPGLAALAAWTGVAAAALLGRRLTVVTVRGRSMEPSFLDGDRVLVRRTRRLAAGDVVVLEQRDPHGQWSQPPLPFRSAPAAVHARLWIIKRVAAVPGDTVPRATVPALASVPEAQVPDGRLVLLGDNPEASLDSRQTGYFPAVRVLGTVVRPVARRSDPRPDTPTPTRRQPCR